ncbi:hypothetical protein IWZ03DRAFT_10269 [Phyllosticta citriasiana]|uniref:Uncharacterized protein n=1 Tax=Phyllosticta citriasiana TaxID=595635 RepID=A0ABR1KY27_9PEZI
MHIDMSINQSINQPLILYLSFVCRACVTIGTLALSHLSTLPILSFILHPYCTVHRTPALSPPRRWSSLYLIRICLVRLALPCHALPLFPSVTYLPTYLPYPPRAAKLQSRSLGCRGTSIERNSLFKLRLVNDGGARAGGTALCEMNSFFRAR